MICSARLWEAKNKTQKWATVDSPEECHTGGMGRLRDNTCLYAELTIDDAGAFYRPV